MASQPIITRRIEPDPEFDAALAGDPQLQAWMKRGFFFLYARLSMFAEKADYSGRYQMAELECPDCRRDYLAIEKTRPVAFVANHTLKKVFFRQR